MTLRERIARAIYGAMWVTDGIPWDSASTRVHRVCYESADAVLAEIESAGMVLVTDADVWTALKEIACSDPVKAKRCVMVSQADLLRAVARASAMLSAAPAGGE